MTHFKSHLRRPAFWIFLMSLLSASLIYQHVRPTYSVEKTAIEVKRDAGGRYHYEDNDVSRELVVDSLLPLEQSPLASQAIAALNAGRAPVPDLQKQLVYEIEKDPNDESKTTKQYYKLQLKKHYGIYSLFPALVAIAFCWITHEPLSALFLASLSGAIMLGHFDYLGDIVLPNFRSKNAALVLVLYLWLLGGLLGIWARTGAARAFAEWVTLRFVSGPRTARLTAWLLGVLFFQGGTVSTVLVGTTVKPVADKHKISHEELSYVVDATASPIACLLAFNAWPAYIQAFLYLPGVAFLATEKDRLAFFFQSLPFSFYAILSVLGTLLFCFDKLPLIGARMRRARERARQHGQLDAPTAHSLSTKEMYIPKVPQGYRPHCLEFVLPLVVLLGIAVGSFVLTGTPEVHLAFGCALLFTISSALIRGMSLKNMIEGLGDGCKGVVMGALILLLAIIIGSITTETGGGLYLVELLGTGIPHLFFPVLLLILTIFIAFSTGTSWGTYAVVYPLAMPLAWTIGADLSHPELFLSICFAVVLNGSVIGDQSSPISDTTILSSMCTGCDLMDHVRTQIIPVVWATFFAAILWTLASLLCA